MPLQQRKTRDELISSALKSLYSIEGSSDRDKIEAIRLALIDLLEAEKQEIEIVMTKPVA